MLTLTNVQPLDKTRFLVTLDRDGTTLEYVFTADEFGINPPIHCEPELEDYERDPPLGPSRGMFDIPAVHLMCRAVDRVSTGRPVELPMVLDER